jgi:Gas vesicle protein K
MARIAPPRWNADPEDVRRSVVKLVLTLIEFVRQLLERQALRRMDAGTLTAEETEAVGLALMRLEETVRDLGAQFDLSPQDLNLDLGPIGKLV